jgi:hypothetical protein
MQVIIYEAKDFQMYFLIVSVMKVAKYIEACRSGPKYEHKKKKKAFHYWSSRNGFIEL